MNDQDRNGAINPQNGASNGENGAGRPPETRAYEAGYHYNPDEKGEVAHGGARPEAGPAYNQPPASPASGQWNENGAPRPAGEFAGDYRYRYADMPSQHDVYHSTYDAGRHESGGAAQNGQIGWVEPSRPAAGYVNPVPPHAREQEAPGAEPHSRPKKAKRAGTRVAALAICCTLAGGAVGGGVGAGVASMMNSEAQPSPVVQATANAVTEARSVAKVSGAMTIAEIYEKVNPAAVAISTESTVRNVFGNRTPVATAGSGFVISEDGYIVTNNHVISGASKIKVTFADGKSYDARVVGRDSTTDIAVLKIEASGLTKVEFGDSDALKVGDPVVAIGNPLGELANTLTSGIISSQRRDINIDGTPMSVLQTDAAISPGNSGGPLINALGQVIGINSAKSAGNGVEGIGFAIPSNEAQIIINKLKSEGYVTGRAELGITVDAFTAEMSRYYELPQGVYITSVKSGSCAEKAGLKVDDIITAIDGKPIKSYSELKLLLLDKSAGDTVNLSYNRLKEAKTVSIKLDEQEPESKFSSEVPASGFESNPFSNDPFGGQFGW